MAKPKKPLHHIHALGMYGVVGFFMLFCAVYILIRTFSPAPIGALSDECPCSGGIEWCICARPTVDALTPFQLFCLANSRLAAYTLYPLYIIMFLSMARNLLAWLQHTVIAEYVPLTSLHYLHSWAGTWIGIVIMWHGLWHMIRWGVQGNLRNLLFDNQTGLTGLVSLVITPIVVWPMRIRWLRQRVSFEIRKRLHYLSWVWAASIAFHAPQTDIVYIVGISLLIYLVDWFYGVFVTTFLAPSARFVRLESFVMIRVLKPEGFQMKGSGGFCYLCVPWISKLEWHAFSSFKDPFDKDYICFCISDAGDWTHKLHQAVSEPIYRRLWIYGPFPSPFETASDNDHIISIASGVGITPALSVIHSLADTRKMHLVWICRDASMLEFMIDYGTKFDEDAYTLIFYTGEREPVFRHRLPYNVKLLKGRPNLHTLIPSLIESAQRNVLVPNVEAYQEFLDDGGGGDAETGVAHQQQANLLEHQFYAEINRLLLTYSVNELFIAAVRRSHLKTRHVSLEGLRDLMQSFFARKFTDDQLKTLLARVDKTGDGVIDSQEFEHFIHEMEKELEKDRAATAKRNLARSQNMTNMGFGTHLDGGGGDGAAAAAAATTGSAVVDNSDHTWRIMYCGGSAPVVEALNEISAMHQIPLSLESFEW